MPVISAIRKATAPITGGMICPPEEATASTAPAVLGFSPIFFIRGMVKVPVVTTLAAPEPLMVPISMLEYTAAWAGPPLDLPTAA